MRLRDLAWRPRAWTILVLCHSLAVMAAEPSAPSSDALLHEQARTLEEAGRRDRSVMVMQQAVLAWQLLLPKAASELERLEVQQHIDGLSAMIQARRQEPVLQSARNQRSDERYAAALALYDQYLAEAPLSPERPVVEGERAQCLTLAKETRGRESVRLGLGYGLLVGGAVAIGAGGALFWLASKSADEASHAPVVGLYDERSHSSAQQSIGGAVLTIAGGLAMIGGVIRLAVGRPEKSPTALWVSPSAGGLAVGGSF